MDSSIDDPRSRPDYPRSNIQDNAPEGSAESSSAKARPGSTARTNIRSACLACRKRRSKCSGGHPCTRCRALETECEYNESQDGRTRALRDRGKEELELHRKVLHGVFRAVREGREQGLLELIRNNASLQHIAAAIADLDVISGQILAPVAESQSFTLADQTIVMPMRGRTIEHEGFSLQVPPILQSAPFSTGHGLSNLTGTSADLVIDPRISPGSDIPDLQHMLQPLHDPDGPRVQQLSNLYINFRDTARELISMGVQPASVLGAQNVPCDLILNPQQVPFNMSSRISIIVNSVNGLDMLFRLAWLSYITRFARWTVMPSKEHYDQMPQAMRPTPLQLHSSHTPVIDLIPIPQMRDRMIENFRDFVSCLERAGATINWNKPISETVDHDPASGSMIISSQFEQHISNVENFWFGRNLLETFPELEGQVKLADVDYIPPNAYNV